MNTARRKVVIKSSMMKRVRESDGKEDSINQFSVDDLNGNIWFSYLGDENIYVYSYLLRRIVEVIKVYNPKLREISKLTL